MTWEEVWFWTIHYFIYPILVEYSWEISRGLQRDRIEQGYHPLSNLYLSKYIVQGYHPLSNLYLSKYIDQGYHPLSNLYLSKYIDQGYHPLSNLFLSKYIDQGYHPLSNLYLSKYRTEILLFIMLYFRMRN